MKKGALLLAVALVASATVAQAKHNMAGCGLGSMIFKENEKPHQILAATTNGFLGNQTFGISSETLGCTKDGLVKADSQRQFFAEANFRSLSQEMSKGNGEYLQAFAGLMGCSGDASKAEFSRFAQSRYDKLFPDGGDASRMLRTLESEMAADARIAQSCTL